MTKRRSAEYADKDNLLHDIEGEVFNAVSEGKLDINYVGGDESDTRFGGGPKSFRCDKFLAGMMAEVKKDLSPRIRNDSDFIRSCVQMVCNAWISLSDGNPNLDKIRKSLEVERLLSADLREEYAKRTAIGYIKGLGAKMNEYRLEGDLEYAISKILEWVDIIKREPDIRFKAKYRNALKAQVEIRDIVRDAMIAGIVDAQKVRDFLDNSLDTPSVSVPPH